MYASIPDLHVALAAQRSAVTCDGVPDIAARIGLLRRMESALLDAAEAFASALNSDFGTRPRAETVLAEIGPVLAALRYNARHLPRWARPQRRRVALNFRPGRGWVEWQPLGCVGIVSPWNYPLLLSLLPTIDAIAAGNRVLLKPSEAVPAFSTRLAALIGEVCDPEWCHVVQGGSEIAAAFCALPFDHLLFTGSTEHGRSVMRAAADNLTPVTLELGGKSPVVVCADYPIGRAGRRVAVGKSFNAGQTCLAPDYALVPAATTEAFAHAVLNHAGRLQADIATTRDYTAIISDRHMARLQNGVAEAERRGARVLRLPSAPTERKLGLAVVIDPPRDCILMQEEIFGPVLPVIGYDDLAQAITIVKERPAPLALYPFTNDRAAARQIMAGIKSGGVTWNNTILHGAQPELPFGGISPNGSGVYHGREGFERFSHPRTIYRSGWFSGFTALTPPYGRSMEFILARILKRRG